MRKLLSADIFRIFHIKWFWLCLGGMFVMSCSFMTMQYTSMDYTVPLSRVIFLPMSFYGMMVAAMVSLFVGEDFSDGFIRNKIIAGHSRTAVFVSILIVSCIACIVIYLLTTLFTTFVGYLFFENDVSVSRYMLYLTMGIAMCLSYSCIYCTITMICGNKTTATVLCMGLSFLLLVVCLRTNQTMIQPEYKNGVPNPAYIDGFVKSFYEFLHNLNPSGQSAQLSAMNVFEPAIFVLSDLIWILIAGVGCAIFNRKNIQ